MTQKSYKKLCEFVYGTAYPMPETCFNHIAQWLHQDFVYSAQESLNNDPEIINIIQKYWGTNAHESLSSVEIVNLIKSNDETIDRLGLAQNLKEDFRLVMINEIENFLGKTPDDDVPQSLVDQFEFEYYIDADTLRGAVRYLGEAGTCQPVLSQSLKN